MMCSRLLKHTQSDKGLAAFLDRLFERLKTRYQRRLHRTLNFRALTVVILAGVMALMGILYLTTPQELAPEEDQGILFTLVKTPQYANLDYLEHSTQRLVQGLRDRAGAGARLRDQRLAGRAHGLRRHPVQALGRAQAQREADPEGAAAEARDHPGRPGGGLLAAGAAGIDRRAAGAVRDHDHRRLSAARQGGRSDAGGGAQERPVHLHRQRPASSTRRRSSSRSTATRRTGWASACTTSATRWRPCWAATTSTASISTAAATR